MEDLNILNRATFDDKQQSFKISVQPCILEGYGTMDLGGPMNVFWVKQISWRYDYIDVGFPGAKVIPLRKPVVTVADIIQDIDTALPPFVQPKPVVGKIEFKVKNTNLANNHRFEIEFLLQGTLVKPKANTEPLPLKAMMAYIMMDSATKGQLAMHEAVADELDQTLSQLGMGSLRESLPKGFGAIKSLPAPIQAMVIQGMVSKGHLPEAMAPYMLPLANNGNKPPLALPDMDPQKEESAFIGDLMEACPDECQDMLKREYLKKIASLMVEKGWRRV
ncbi:hypothetical protein C4588_03000 [Candidatus Parcubacteria bacterium]|nr:MAG: hypothetical protein C4588_03000 [Candidatus Parcubacteria bacterium]